MKRLIVSPAPHIDGGESTKRLMRDVIVALLPITLASLYFFGLSALKVILLGVGSAVLVEFLIQKYILKSRVEIGDYSAALTGLLLALNLPPSSPWWMVVMGSFIAIAVAKMTFGGLGQNLFNPALVGRVFLLVSFPVQMTNWSVESSIFRPGVDGWSGATPLAIVKEGLSSGLTMEQIFDANSFSYGEMLFSRIGGSVGEISAIALLIGLAYLLIRKVIKPHIPLAVLGSVALFSGLLWLLDPLHNPDPLFALLTGGVLIGAIFMATDYVTSPMSKKGMVIFGIGIGFLTVVIRKWGAYPEGVSFAILIMNSTVPLINSYIKPKKFGKKEVKRG